MNDLGTTFEKSALQTTEWTGREGAPIQLLADGAPIHPMERVAGAYRFLVPRNVRSVALQAVPFAPQTAAASPAAELARTGIDVAEIAIRSGARDTIISADDPRLDQGWSDPEIAGQRIWRRTRGTASIPWKDVAGPAFLIVRCPCEPNVPAGHAPPDSKPATVCPDSSLWQRRPEPELLKTELVLDFALFALASEARSIGANEKRSAIGQWPGQLETPYIVTRRQSDEECSAASAAIRLQWCLGLYSSGSTWAFNAIRLIGSLLQPGPPHAGVYAERLDQLPADLARSDRLIVKSHHTDAAASTLLGRHADRIWISIRDPRDSVASAATYVFPDFDAALSAVVRSAEHCEKFIQDPRSILLRYEDGFIDDPATLDRFAAIWPRTLTPRERDQLFRQTRRPEIDAMIQELDPADTVDDGYQGHRVHLATQWHTHHVNRTGEIGRWRHTLDAAQVEQVQARLGPWMERFGYDP